MLIIPQLGLPELARQTVERNAEFSSFVAHLSVLGPILLRGSAVPASMSLITQLTQSHQSGSTHSQAASIYVEGLELSEADSATNMLNLGAKVVFFLRRIGQEQAASRTSTLQSFPRSRVGVSMRITMGPGAQAVSDAMIAIITMVDDTNMLAEHLLLDMLMSPLSDILALLTSIKEMLELYRGQRRAAVQIYICIPASALLSNDMLTNIAEMALEDVHLCVTPVLVPASESVIAHRMTSAKVLHSPYLDSDRGLVDILHAYISTLQSDRKDGLFATVVCDQQGVCLGLVYSNTDSIRISFMQRKGVYFSRSTGKVWYKGASSGNPQELLSIRIDCDSDALQFKVVQRGTHFCHKFTHTCWGDVNGIDQLERSILDRRRNATTESYTARLLRDTELLNTKLIEQAEELTEAADKEDIAEEASKLLYFLLTKCVAEDVSLAHVVTKLDARSAQITRQTALNNSSTSVLTPSTKSSRRSQQI